MSSIHKGALALPFKRVDNICKIHPEGGLILRQNDEEIFKYRQK